MSGKIPEASEELTHSHTLQGPAWNAPGTFESSLGVPLTAVQRPDAQSPVFSLLERSQRGFRGRESTLWSQSPLRPQRL